MPLDHTALIAVARTRRRLQIEREIEIARKTEQIEREMVSLRAAVIEERRELGEVKAMLMRVLRGEADARLAVAKSRDSDRLPVH